MNKDGGSFHLLNLDVCSLGNELTLRQDIKTLAVDFGASTGTQIG
jgi:hypothetical protein